MKNYDLHFKTDHVRSLLHTEVLKVFIDLKCLQLVFLGRRSLMCLMNIMSLKRSCDSFSLLS